MAATKFVSEEMAKKILGIESFETMPLSKIKDFVPMISKMDKEVAMASINQFPAYADAAKLMVNELNVMCENIMAANESSRKDVVQAYQKILDSLEGLLKKDNLTAEEQHIITLQMIEVADKMADKDSENKQFLSGIMKYGSTVIAGALVIGAAILGANVSGNKLPPSKK